MDYFKQQKTRSILISALFICLGLVLIIFPDHVAQAVSYVFSVMVLIIGGIYVIMYFLQRSPENTRNFTTGLVLIAAAVYCMINSRFLVSILPVVLGFTILVNGISKLVHVFDLLSTSKANWLSVLIMSGVMVCFGVVLLINPFGAGVLFYIMLGIGFLLGGLTDLITLLLVSRKIHDIRQDAEAIDVTDYTEKKLTRK